MAQSKIKINAVIGSNDDLPINTLVNLDNQNNGGELSFAWSIIDQPLGAADTLSSLVVQAPSFTPKKEGTYLLQLIVNPGPLQLVDRQIVGIRQLKTRERVPAAQEDVQDGSRGWATAAGSNLQRLDNLYGNEAGIVVGVNGSGGAMARGDLLRITDQATIKTGLPGQETVPSFNFAEDNGFLYFPQQFYFSGPILILESGVDGSLTPASGDLIRARLYGRFEGMTDFPFFWTVNDDVYAGANSHRPKPLTTSFTVGAFARRIGTVINAPGATQDIWFDGTGTVGKPHHIHFGAQQLSNIVAATAFLYPGYNDTPVTVQEVAIPIVSPCNIFGLAAHAVFAGAGLNAGDLIVRLNGVDTAIQVSLPPGSTDAFDISGQFVQAFPGDTLAIRNNCTAAGISAPANVVATVSCLPMRPQY